MPSFFAAAIILPTAAGRKSFALVAQDRGVVGSGDPAGPPGNLNVVRHFDMPSDLRDEIIHARIWAGLQYHFSGVAGVVLTRNVAAYDLRHALGPVE
jgi:hypothetical protein